MLTDKCTQSLTKIVVIVGITFILFTIASVISINTLYRIIHRHKSIKSFPLPLYIMQIIFYIFSIIYLLSELFALFIHCFISQQSTLQIINASPGIIYFSHWSSLLLILFCRLYYSFLGTVLALSKSYIYTFIFSLIFLFIGVLTPMILLKTSNDKKIWIWSNTIFATALFLAIIVSQYVSFTYIYKLLRINNNVVCKSLYIISHTHCDS